MKKILSFSMLLIALSGISQTVYKKGESSPSIYYDGTLSSFNNVVSTLSLYAPSCFYNVPPSASYFHGVECYPNNYVVLFFYFDSGWQPFVRDSATFFKEYSYSRADIEPEWKEQKSLYTTRVEHADSILSLKYILSTKANASSTPTITEKSNWNTAYGWGNHATAGYLTNLSSFSTSNLNEGTNLYWTTGRFSTAFGTKSTTDLTEGSNLYYTAARFNSALSGKTTSDLTEGTNKYYTDARARASITFSTTGSGAATYNSSTGALNVPTPSIKRQETYSGTTNGSGIYMVTFGTAYSVAPNIQANLIGNATNQYLRITSISTTGFTVNAYSFVTNTVLGIINITTSTANLTGASIDVLITEK